MESSATGVLSMVAALANAQSRNHEVSIIYSRRPETPDDLSTYFGSGIALHNVQMSKFWDQILAIPRMMSLIKRLNPRIAFLHSSKAGFLGRMALWNRAEGVRVIYIPHCISFMRRDVGRITRLAFELLERAAAVTPAVYIACSDSERKHIRRALPNVECLVIENAVTVDVPCGGGRSKRQKDQPGKRRVVSVGQIRRQKDPGRFAELASRCAASDVEFVWAGDGDQTLRTQLRDAGVQVLGWCSKSEIIELLSCADVYLSTSLWEGMPVSAIEAMAVGVPLVLSDCDGNRDLVRDGVTGLLYRDIPEGEAALRRMLCDSDLALRISTAAHDEFTRRFNFERYRDSMESLMI